MKNSGKIKRSDFLKIIAPLCLATMLSGCWQVAAARAAKKRKSQTGYVVGTIEKEAGVADPLGRKQKSVDFDGEKTDENSDK